MKCKYKEARGFHYAIKQCSASENIVTVDFQSHNICITQNTDYDRCVLTHILILILHMRESYWTNTSKSSIVKGHELAAKLAHFNENEVEILASDSDLEKENSPIKATGKS